MSGGKAGERTRCTSRSSSLNMSSGSSHRAHLTRKSAGSSFLLFPVQTDGYVLDDRSWSPEQRVRFVAQARGDFVALLGPGRRFEHLVDRRALLEALGTATVSQ